MFNIAIYSYSNRDTKRKRYLILGHEGKNRVQHCLTHNTIFEESPIVVTCPSPRATVTERLPQPTATASDLLLCKVEATNYVR